MLDTIALELVSVGAAEDLVAGDFGCDDLNDNIPVSEADDEAVFGGVVFVLGLSNKTLAGVIVGFTCATTLVFGLVAAAAS